MHDTLNIILSIKLSSGNFDSKRAVINNIHGCILKGVIHRHFTLEFCTKIFPNACHRITTEREPPECNHK